MKTGMSWSLPLPICSADAVKLYVVTEVRQAFA